MCDRLAHVLHILKSTALLKAPKGVLIPSLQCTNTTTRCQQIKASVSAAMRLRGVVLFLFDGSSCFLSIKLRHLFPLSAVLGSCSLWDSYGDGTCEGSRLLCDSSGRGKAVCSVQSHYFVSWRPAQQTTDWNNTIIRPHTWTTNASLIWTNSKMMW